MSSFMVRVELHGYAPQTTYDALHNAMARAGFGRRIRADDGTWYDLPQAEYFGSAPSFPTAVSLRNALAQVVNSLWLPNSVIVTEASAVAWSVPRQTSLAASLLFGNLPANKLLPAL